MKGKLFECLKRLSLFLLPSLSALFPYFSLFGFSTYESLEYVEDDMACRPTAGKKAEEEDTTTSAQDNGDIVVYICIAYIYLYLYIFIYSFSELGTEHLINIVSFLN